MATKKQQAWPATYKVVNKSQRPRVRGGVYIPGVKKGEEPKPVEVPIKTRGQYLRLSTCRDLELSKGSAAKTRGGAKASGSGKAADSAGGDSGQSADTGDGGTGGDGDTGGQGDGGSSTS